MESLYTHARVHQIVTLIDGLYSAGYTGPVMYLGTIQSPKCKTAKIYTNRQDFVKELVAALVEGKTLFGLYRIEAQVGVLQDDTLTPVADQQNTSAYDPKPDPLGSIV